MIPPLSRYHNPRRPLMAWVTLYKSGGILAKRGLIMQLVTRKLKDIHLYPNNPRKNAGAVEAVAESIRQCGYVAPIIVDEDGVILAGHTRYKALKKLGRTEADVIVKDGLTEEQKKKYRLLDNKTNELADWDLELLAHELEGLDFGALNLEWELPEENETPVEHKETAFNETISVIVNCDSDEQAEDLFTRLSEEGYECHISTL